MLQFQICEEILKLEKKFGKHSRLQEKFRKIFRNIYGLENKSEKTLEKF